MRAFKESSHPGDGLIAYSPNQNQMPAFGTAILCQYPMVNFRIIDIPPWGLILPIIGATDESVRYNFEAETYDMPKGTVLGIRWTPHSGNNIHTLTITLPGDGQPGTLIQIPDAWILESEGQAALIEYEASLPDGSVRLGRSFDVQVSKPLEYGDVHVGDLVNDGVLHPDKYPDGIKVTIDPIVNAEEYNTIRFFWNVYGHLGNTRVLLAEWLNVINCAPGKTYEFVVPPEAYSGLFESRFDYVSVSARPSFILLPEPMTQMRWGFGAKGFVIEEDTN